MEALHNSETSTLVDSSESGQDVRDLAPDVFEMLALELGPLVDNQVFGPYLLGGHNAIQGRRHFLGRGPVLEHC